MTKITPVAIVRRNRPRTIPCICKYDSVEFLAANKNAEFCPKPKTCRQKYNRGLEAGLQPSLHRRPQNPRRLAPAVARDVPRDVLNRMEHQFSGEAGEIRDEKQLAWLERPLSSILPAVKVRNRSGNRRWKFVDADGNEISYADSVDRYLAERGVFTADFSEWLVCLLDAGWPVSRHLSPSGPRDQFGWNEDAALLVDVWSMWLWCLLVARLTPAQIWTGTFGRLIANV